MRSSAANQRMECDRQRSNHRGARSIELDPVSCCIRPDRVCGLDGSEGRALECVYRDERRWWGDILGADARQRSGWRRRCDQRAAAAGCDFRIGTPARGDGSVVQERYGIDANADRHHSDGAIDGWWSYVFASANHSRIGVYRRTRLAIIHGRPGWQPARRVARWPACGTKNRRHS